jgi:hypothetical protein
MECMSKQSEGADWQSSARGESAWKETRERVAARNDEVRKSGKVEREGYERERESTRQTAAAKRQADVRKRRPR